MGIIFWDFPDLRKRAYIRVVGKALVVCKIGVELVALDVLLLQIFSNGSNLIWAALVGGLVHRHTGTKIYYPDFFRMFLMKWTTYRTKDCTARHADNKRRAIRAMTLLPAAQSPIAFIGSPIIRSMRALLSCVSTGFLSRLSQTPGHKERNSRIKQTLFHKKFAS